MRSILQRCKAPAMKGKQVCKFHGGLSTGPRTEIGRQRCAEAKTVHGRETRRGRIEQSIAMHRLRAIEELGHALGIFNGSKTPGRKPQKN
ncbi:MAG: hypothetical protein EBR90_03915 [Actinobacteria bacterium]|nr:hypothetical protein [Actinomycetota bacterium]